MKMNLCCVLLILSLFCTISAEIIHITRIKEIVPYITHEKTLVVFDIDNTLLHPKTDLGSDQWFYSVVQEKIESGMDAHTAIQHILPLYFHINFKIDLIPTEPDLHEHVELIKNLAEHTIGLTIRSFELIEKTIEQLSKNKLHFKAPEHKELVLDLPHPCIYRGNIIFCNLNDKGQALFAFIDKIGYEPDVIIFVDDKEKHVHSVKKAADSRNIKVFSFRYAGCDERVQAFNKDATDQELEEFLLHHPFQCINA